MGQVIFFIDLVFFAVGGGGEMRWWLKSVSRGGGRNKGGRKQSEQTQTNASKRRGENASKRRGENASKRGQTQTNIYTSLYCGFLHPPLQSPYKIAVKNSCSVTSAA